MRAHISATAITVMAAAILAVPAFASPTLKHQINVTVTNGGCTLLSSVSKRNTTILFYVINNADAARGFSIYGVRSGMIKAHQSGRFGVKFRGSGSYKYQCVSGAYPHPKVVAKGLFTIRKS